MAMKKIYENLLVQIEKTKSLPFLFIGSGLSKRYLNTPNWHDLLEHFAKITKRHNYAYEEYANRAKEKLYAENIKWIPDSCMSMTTIADLIEFDFNNYWYTATEYAASRNNKPKNISPFKYEISQYLSTYRIPKDSPLKNEIELFAQVANSALSGIITTNYDLMIDSLIDSYDTYIGQNDMIFSYMLGGSEYYKIHGCITKPDSLVINSEDYRDFNERNAYLSSKLLTIFMEHPIIFIGYSLSDENIESILSSIVICLSQDQLNTLQDRMIFINYSETLEERQIINKTFKCGKSLPLTQISTNDFWGLYDCLSKNIPKTNIKLINKIKKEIVGLIITTEPSRFLCVNQEDIDYSKINETELFVGLGKYTKNSKHGYVSIKPEAIYIDALFDTNFETIYNDFDCDLFVNDTIAEIISSHGGIRSNFPIYKYVTKCSMIKNPKITEYINRRQKFDNYIPDSVLEERANYPKTTLKSLIENPSNNAEDILFTIKQLSEDDIDPILLKSFLIEYIEKYPDAYSKPMIGTEYRRAVSILDWFSYGSEFHKKKNITPKQ